MTDAANVETTVTAANRKYWAVVARNRKRTRQSQKTQILTLLDVWENKPANGDETPYPAWIETALGAATAAEGLSLLLRPTLSELNVVLEHELCAITRRVESIANDVITPNKKLDLQNTRKELNGLLTLNNQSLGVKYGPVAVSDSLDELLARLDNDQTRAIHDELKMMMDSILVNYIKT